MPEDLVYPADIADTLPGPDWLRRQRAAAARRALDLPLPSFEAEEWRYSPIESFSAAEFAPAATGPAPDAAPAPVTIDGAAATVHTVDGFVVAIESTDQRGLEISSASASGPEIDFGTAIDVFGETNTAFAPAPIVVRVARGADIAGPVVITHDVLTAGVAAFPRVHVEVGDDAQVDVVEIFRSADVSALVVPVSRVTVGPAARVGYQQIQELGRQIWQLGTLVVDVGGQATFVGGIAALGAGYGRLRTDCRLVGRGATGNLVAVYYGDGDQTLDFRTFQEHIGRDTTSNLLFKGVLDDSSTSIYTGMIHVAPDAAGTNAFQTNRNIKLSEHAWAESVPNLQIENNDVRCSHASTVSPVDPEQRFYLESRGVPTGEAERLVVEGFLIDVVAALPVAALAGHIAAMIADKLDGRSTS